MHCFVLLFVDLFLIAASTLLAIILCSTQAPLSALADAGTYCAFTFVAAVPVLLLFRLNRTVWRFASMSDSAAIVGAAVTIVVLATSLGFSFDRLRGVPRTVPVMHGLLILYALGGARIATRIRHVRRRRARRPQVVATGNRENVLVVGLNPLADLFLYCAAENGHDSVNIVGVLSDSERHRGRLLRSRRILGPMDAIREVLHDLSVHGVFVDRIVIAAPFVELSVKAQTSLDDLARDGNIRVEHLSAQYGLGDRVGDGAFNSTRSTGAVVATELDDELPSSSYLRWKRSVDAAVALVCVVCFAPLMLAVFVVVLLDVGVPAIFWQQRPGARGRPIRVLKFRTMGAARDKDGRPLADAMRVTKIGHLLRRLRLDELPQVYNVLLGHMSFVGPRPLLPVDQPSAPAARLRLRPGLTGWAQIKGGRHLSIEDKAALDLWYIKNASFALDMMILAHTVRMVLFGERVDRNAIQQAWQALRNDHPTLRPADVAEHNPA